MQSKIQNCGIPIQSLQQHLARSALLETSPSIMVSYAWCTRAIAGTVFFGVAFAAGSFLFAAAPPVPASFCFGGAFGAGPKIFGGTFGAGSYFFGGAFTAGSQFFGKAKFFGGAFGGGSQFYLWRLRGQP